MTRVVSVQSSVASGMVGNRAAGFVLERLGVELVRIDSATLSHPPGAIAARGRMTPPEEIMLLLEGLSACGALGNVDALLSGYLGLAETGPCVLAALREVRALRPDALYACDPVIGDHGRIYVAPGLVRFFAEQALPQADIVTPNAFELGILSASAVGTLAEALAAGEVLRARMAPAGRGIMLATGLSLSGLQDGDAEGLQCLLLAPEGRFLCAVPRRAGLFSGAGDVFAALFLFHYLERRSAPEALGLAAAAMAALMASSPEGVLALVAAQAGWAGVAAGLAVQAV